MNPDLHDPTWMTAGTSLLWDAAALHQICAPEAVRSLRELLRLHHAGWPAETLNLVHQRTLVVAGLEAALDTLAPEAAVEWMEQTVYAAIIDFQQRVADGGREAALIFWLADGARVFPRPAEDTFHWHCAGAHRGQSLPIGRCLWNGAEASARRITTKNAAGKPVWAGLFHPRVS